MVHGIKRMFQVCNATIRPCSSRGTTFPFHPTMSNQFPKYLLILNGNRIGMGLVLRTEGQALTLHEWCFCLGIQRARVFAKSTSDRNTETGGTARQGVS